MRGHVEQVFTRPAERGAGLLAERQVWRAGLRRAAPAETFAVSGVGAPETANLSRVTAPEDEIHGAAYGPRE